MAVRNMASCSQWNCTSAIYKEILDGKIKESLPMETDQSSGRDFCHPKKMTRSNTDETDSRTPDTGNDSASTAPRSTKSLFLKMLIESGLSPLQDELISSDDLWQDKLPGALSLCRLSIRVQ